MTVTKTHKAFILGDVAAVVEAVVSGDGTMFLGTDKGTLYKYNETTSVLTKLQTIHGGFTCGVYDDSANIYWGTSKGKVLKYVISTGAFTTLYISDEAILSIDLYSSTLWIGLAGGEFINLTVS